MDPTFIAGNYLLEYVIPIRLILSKEVACLFHVIFFYFRMWSGENSHKYHESTLHPKKIGDVVRHVQEKNCGAIFFSHQQLLGICTRILFNSLCPR